MEVYRRSSGLLLLLGFVLLATTLQGVQGEVESEGPSESECRPYIEKALKELEAGEAVAGSSEIGDDSKEDIPTVEITDDSEHRDGEGDDNDSNEDGQDSKESTQHTVSEPKSEPEVRQTMFQKITNRISQFFQRTPINKTKEAAIEENNADKEAEDSRHDQDPGSVEDDNRSDETDAKDDSKEDEIDAQDDSVEATADDGNSKEDDDKEEAAEEQEASKETDDSQEDGPEVSKEEEKEETDGESREGEEQAESEEEEEAGTEEGKDEVEDAEERVGESEEAAEKSKEDDSEEHPEESKEEDTPQHAESVEDKDQVEDESKEQTGDGESKEENGDSKEDAEDDDDDDDKADDGDKDSKEDADDDGKDDVRQEASEEKSEQDDSKEELEQTESKEEEEEGGDSVGKAGESDREDEGSSKEQVDQEESKEEQRASGEDKEDTEEEVDDDNRQDADVSKEGTKDESEEDKHESAEEEKKESGEDKDDTGEDKTDSKEDTDDANEASKEDDKSGEDKIIEKREAGDEPEDDDSREKIDESEGDTGYEDEDDDDDDDSEESTRSTEGDAGPVEELSGDIEIPSELRSRDHVEHLLKLDEESSETESVINRVNEITLKELKKLYENAIKPLETLYKYRDLSNRHFGDSEIFSKPLVLFMGPWSGGKSSIINYLTNIEYNETALRTGAEPSPAYFNILMYGDEPEILDGTELAADFTFSGLQKFGQGLEERLRGLKVPSNLLEKVNIVEIPGILEVRKQVSRVFPFNDACQWFIDRADIIFLVYDPSKLDVGPETEAILDQLKGREHQTRIVLNKADQVKPEELMRVQGALIWNISPLMSSPQPPVMYTTSLWSRPFEPWAPTKLLQAQERAFLRDLRGAIDKRIENKIASARRFAVRVRNHAKMVDCYLTTYYNHKSVFGNRKQVADEIVDHPQDYHIYEGLSTLTNISRYDLPDPDVYRDFFKLNPLYEFQQLSATCTYFRGCPINRLDIAIAYDLPELVGTHKKLIENALAEAAAANQSTNPGS